MSEVSILAAVLAELSDKTGKTFNASSFASRLRIQKSVYLLKILGMREMTHYGFSYYVRGPYSTELAKDYYALQATQVTPTEVQIPNRMIVVIKQCIDKGDSFLEAVSTLHSIAKIRKSRDKSDVIGAARSMKPELSQTYDEAWDFVKATGLF